MNRHILGAGMVAALVVAAPTIGAAPQPLRGIAAAVASADRPEEDKARDADRKADAAKRNVGESLEKAGNDLTNE